MQGLFLAIAIFMAGCATTRTPELAVPSVPGVEQDIKDIAQECRNAEDWCHAVKAEMDESLSPEAYCDHYYPGDENCAEHRAAMDGVE